MRDMTHLEMASTHDTGDRLMPHANRIGRIESSPAPPRKVFIRPDRPLGLLAACLIVALIPPVRAEGPRHPEPTALRAYPPEVKLRGPDSVQQVIIDATRPGQEAFDLTDEVAF